MNEQQGQFHIYGRTSYEQPLSFVKEIMVKASVAQETLAEVGEEGWIELVAIPTEALLQVTGAQTDD